MQPSTGAPRTHLSAATVDAILHADDSYVEAWGADLLDLDDKVLADVTSDLAAAVDGGARAPVVSWSGTVDIHRQVSLTIARRLQWDRDRLRLWLTMRSDLLSASATFYAGVFVMHSADQSVDDSALLTPTANIGAGPGDTLEHTATGLDKLHLLASPIPLTWTLSTEGTTYDAELRRLLTAAGWRGAFTIDPRLTPLVIPEPHVWPADGQVTWLQVLNEALDDVAAARAWCDEVGTLRLNPKVAVAERTVEYTADAQSPRTIVGPRRTRSGSLLGVPNCWRFTASSWPRTPTEGDGQYTPAANTGDGPTSTAARGREVWSLQTLDVATHDALVAAGTDIRAADIRAAATRSVTVGTLPTLGHHDLLELRDTILGEAKRALLTAWTLPFDGSDCSLTAEEVP